MDFGLFNLMGYRSQGATTREILQDTVERQRSLTRAAWAFHGSPSITSPTTASAGRR